MLSIARVDVGRVLSKLPLISNFCSGPIGTPLPRAPEHGDCIYLDYQATTPVFPEVGA